MAFWVRSVLGVALIAGVIGGGWYYVTATSQPAGATPVQGPGRGGPARAQPVVAGKAEVGPQPVEFTAIGSVTASETVSVRSRVDGTILEVHFKEGDLVKEGDLLFTIDPRAIQAQLRQAEANLARTKVILANANRDLDRQNALAAKNFATQAALDAARSSSGQAQQNVRATEAEIEALKVQLGFTQIRAPITGRTGQVPQTKGNIVRSGDATFLVTIRKVNPIAVTFSVPQQHFSALRQAMAGGDVSVKATVPGQPDQQGKVVFFDNQIDTNTGTFSVKAQFDNRQDVLWPGMFVTAVVQFGIEPKAITVPTAAVQAGQQGQYVYVIEDKDGGKAVTLVPVDVSRQQGDRTVISKGLSGTEQVVVDGQLRLVNGTKVDVRDPNAPVQAGGGAGGQRQGGQRPAPQG